MIELLSPSGNKESFLAGVNNGADAVYLGLNNFSARSNIENFNFDELAYIIKYAKLFDVKVYVTINTIIKDCELPMFFEAVKKAYLLGADAFIVQDIFLGKELKNRFPEIVLHLSTQAGISNRIAVPMVKEYGFSRIVLARETPLREIEEISKLIETEVFIQGALCTSYSGHCYFSSFVGGNSGNRGLCKQPCRMMYKYKSGKNCLKDNCYALSLADLSVQEKIQDLINAGVSSFKIEGRMRRAEYVAQSTKYYRNIIDNIKSYTKINADISPLKRTFNRGDYTYGLAFSQDKNFISSKIQGHKGEEIGLITDIEKNNVAKVKVTNNYLGELQDAYKIISNGKEVANGIFKSQLKNIITINYKGNINIGDNVNITTDTNENKKILLNKKLMEINIEACFKQNEKAKFCVKFKNQSFLYESESIIEASINSPLTKSQLISAFNKTDEYPFIIKMEVKVLDNIFIRKSELNQIRRDIYEKIFNFYNQEKALAEVSLNKTVVLKEQINCDKKLAIISQTFEFEPPKNLSEIIFSPENYNSDDEFTKFSYETKNFNVKKFLFVPAFFKNEDIEIIKKHIFLFDGIYADSYQGISLAKALKKQLFYGLGCNIFNNTDIDNLPIETEKIALSKELCEKEIMSFNSNNYVFNLGNIAVMDLIYCPFNRDCKNCKVKGSISLTDKDNRVFRVRRYKLSDCRFEVYNAYDLLYTHSLKNNLIYNFVNYDKETINKILSNLENYATLKEIIKDYTGGNLTKGVI